MDPLSTRLALGAAGAAGGAAAGLGVEDVFSTYLYEDSGSTQTITNGIDLNGEGGMVVVKARTSSSYNHQVFDTERGASQLLYWSSTSSSGNNTPFGVNAFNSDGFDVEIGATGQDMVSWTFRKAPGFFDVVTYAGNGTAGRTISHNLGSVPGCIIVKNTTSSWGWNVYHRGVASDAETDYLLLNSTAAASDDSGRWNDTAPTSSVFTVGTGANVNASGSNYVAYLFAHDEQIFGENADQSIIKCGSYTGNGSATGPTVDLGWEPQWLLIKDADTAGPDWYLVDNMRGWTADGSGSPLKPNSTNIEGTYPTFKLNSQGFQLATTSTDFNRSGNTYIYIAIRRGPMKTPTDATTVFDIKTKDGATTLPAYKTSFPVDVTLRRNNINSADSPDIVNRLTSSLLYPNKTDAETASSSISGDFAFNNGYDDGAVTDATDYGYLFRRAPGFFDVVAYTGDGVSTGQYINHSLGVNPEMIIVKPRKFGWPWHVFHKDLGAGGYMQLQSDSSFTTNPTVSFGSVTPTATQFFRKGSNDNASGQPYIAYLFATCPGVSKVGSYTGTGSNINVNCGFSAGARFVLIKRTDSTGDWYVWDTARGIVSGNDPYWLINPNPNPAQVTTTDYIDPLNAGFTVTSSAPAALNASGGSYIFLAIA